MSGESSVAVLPDPQISMAKVLRPWDGFEGRYEGQAANIPVSFYEVPANGDDMKVRDEMAARPGYDPNLERFIATPLGSRCTLWIPYCFLWSTQAILETSYTYTFHWRIRNMDAFLSEVNRSGGRMGYHSLGLNGYPDPRFPGPTPGSPAPRFAIPGATNSVVIEQLEPAGDVQAFAHLRRERLRVIATYADSSQLSILPDGSSGTRQQGIVDFGSAVPQGIVLSESYLKVDFVSGGDELLIQANRHDAWGVAPAPWSFTTTDGPFSNIYGRNVGGSAQAPAHTPPNGSGIYLFTGTAP